MIYLSANMQFNNPNILYALFALFIPVIVHLFQLRKFQKTAFTNVKILKELVVKTRKSAHLKKWLLLACRLLIFTCIILAFSEPSLTQKEIHLQKPETVFYIDNSFSNQEKGEKGELLKITIQELLENYPNDEKINIITNTQYFKHKTLNEIKTDLINLEYTPFQLDYKSIVLKAEQLFQSEANKQLICISDFQNRSTLDSSYFNSSYDTKLIQVLPVSKSNISIDTAYFSTQNTSSTYLNITVKKQHSNLKNVPISIYNNDSIISKTAVDLKDVLNTISISVPNTSRLNLKIHVTDQKCVNDNILFVSKSKPEKHQVLAIGTLEKNDFLSKIFTEDEFIFTQFTALNIDFSTLDNQHLIVLNELETISMALSKNLKTFSNHGGIIVCIPSEKGNLLDYNNLNNVFGNEDNNEVRLTKIHFSHPIFSNVFEKEISNFQYPTFKSHYKLKNYQNSLLTFENGNPLLVNNNNFYTFSSALNVKNTNFKQAPLIVPTLYNIAKNSLKPVIPYYVIGRENTIDIPIKLEKDEVLNLQKKNFSFTPLQQIKSEKVTLNIFKTPSESGLYTVTNRLQKTAFTLAFNYDKSESIMKYHDITTLENKHIKTDTSVVNTINSLNSIAQVATLWKWFVILAILFLLVELLILKYFK
jgi:hypothetical protein